MDAAQPATRGNCLLLAGGGTGGHVAPGLAVAEQALRSGAFDRVVFAGTNRPAERHLLELAGVEHRAMPDFRVLPSPRHPVRWASNGMQALRAARGLITQCAPRIVVGLGGAASVVPAVAARLAGIPLVLLEQNVVPGRATRFLARWASAACVSFAQTADRLRKAERVELTGNPVRAEIADLAAPVDRAPAAPPGGPRLLVLGGSQGSQAVNDAIMALIGRRPLAWRDCRFAHQTGFAQQEVVRAFYARHGLQANVQAFFGQMAEQYRVADLVISRAGATTLAELACAGLAAVLLPFPQATDNHQVRNAAEYAEAGAAVVVRQRASPCETAAALEQPLLELLGDAQSLARMRRAMRRLARPAAARAVLEVLQSCARQSTC